MTDLTRIRAGRFAPVLMFAIVVVVANVGSFNLSRGITPDTVTPAKIDFDETVYYPTVAFAEGANPYNPSYRSRYPVDNPFPPYAPSTLVVHLPFAFMPLEVAALAYAALTVVLTVVVAYVAIRFNDVAATSTRVFLVAALLLLSRPGRQNLLNGQITLEVVLGTYVALYYSRRRPIVSGLGVAASMLKPTFGIPLAVLLLARRDARAVVTGVVITAAANVPLLAILVRRDAPAVAAGAVTTPAANVPLPASLAKRAGELSTFLGEALSTVGGFHRNPESNPATSSLRIDLSALVSRFLGDPMAGARQLVLALAIIAMSAYVVSAAARVERGGTQGLSATVICLVILLCAYHQAYDLVLLTLPVIALAARRLPAELFSPRLRWALLLLFAGLAGNYASSFGVLERLGIYAPADRATPSAQIAWLLLVTLNGAALLLLFVSYSVATLRLARSSPRAGATITASETWRPREPAT